MTAMEEVTVVIPTFRRPQLLARAIRSVLNQTYPHVRAAVFDNASGDETAAIVKEIASSDARVTYHAHVTNIGAAANFKFATSSVETSLFIALSDDDLLLPELCEEAVGELGSHPDAWFHCSRTVVYNELANGLRRPSRSWKAGYYQAGAANAEHMLRDHFVTTGVVFRRGVLETIGSLGDYPLDREYVAAAAALYPFTVSEKEQSVLVIHHRSFSAGQTSTRTDETRNVGVVYARECLLSALSRVVDMPKFTPTEKRNLFNAAMRCGRTDTIYHLAFKAIPDGRFDEVDEVLAIAPWLGFGLGARSLLRVLRLSGRLPGVRFLTIRVARAVVKVLTKMNHTPVDAPENREIVEYIQSGATRPWRK